jgi:hypothetical protein
MAQPVVKRAIWCLRVEADDMVVSLCLECQCGVCLSWIPVLKPKKRTTVVSSDVESVSSQLLASPGDGRPAVLLNDSPVLIAAGLKADGTVYVPTKYTLLTKRSLR